MNASSSNPQPPKGDLAKRLGNPTLVGVLGFLVPFSSTIFCLLQFQGSNPSSIAALSGTFYFFGGIAMNIVGTAELILGNSFPMAVFIIYGCHWVNLVFVNDPVHAIVASYVMGSEPGALAQLYNAGQGHYTIVMTLITFVFLCGSLRIDVPFVIVFFDLVFVFSFLAAGYYQLGYDPTVAGWEHAVYYFKIAGGFGLVSVIRGWYLRAIITVCATTGVLCPLPIFDLSQRVFAHNTNAQKGEHAGTVTLG